MHADSPIQSVADLRGKSIAVGKGSSAHGHILGQLEKAGLTPSDVKLVFLQPADALSAFTQRQADAWAIWDPYTAQAEPQYRCAASPRPRASPTATGSVSLGSGARRPQAQHRVVGSAGALRKGGALGQGSPAQWADSYAAAVGLDPKVAAVPQGRSLRLPTELDDEVVASEQKLADLFAASEQIPAAPKFDDWVDRRYNDALRPLLVSSN